MKIRYILFIISLLTAPIMAQEWNPLPPPEFEQVNFLLSETTMELNIDFVMTWTDDK